MSGRQYTWVGPEDCPTFEKLDRVLVSTEWESQFPLTTVDSRVQTIHVGDGRTVVLTVGW